MGQAGKRVACPTCRTRVIVDEINLVRTGLEAESSSSGSAPDEASLEIKGSYSTKVRPCAHLCVGSYASRRFMRQGWLSRMLKLCFMQGMRQRPELPMCCCLPMYTLMWACDPEIPVNMAQYPTSPGANSCTGLQHALTLCASVLCSSICEDAAAASQLRSHVKQTQQPSLAAACYLPVCA